MTAAKTTAKAAPAQTPEAPAIETPEGNVDVVAMPSRRADGSAHQTPGYVSLLEGSGAEPDSTEA